MSEYIEGRLEASAHNKFYCVWSSISISSECNLQYYNGIEHFNEKILSIFLQEPNPEDPLNKEAAEILQTNKRLFEHNVAKAMRGSYIGETYFERCLK